MWDIVKETTQVAELEGFLLAFPDGAHRARLLVEQLLAFPDGASKRRACSLSN